MTPGVFRRALAELLSAKVLKKTGKTRSMIVEKVGAAVAA